MKKWLAIPLLVLCALPQTVNAADNQKPTKPKFKAPPPPPKGTQGTPDGITLFGVALNGAERDLINTQLKDIEGFSEARSTQKEHTFDKYFPTFRKRELYYVEFHYTPDGQLYSAKEVYRPVSTRFENKLSPIQTHEVALKLSEKIGQPSRIERKSADGTPSYRAYVWDGKNVTVTVDRVGSEIYGDVFVLYQMKINPYLVASR
ncbi:hypothetical protein [Hydrogenovibrio kuenenii]|uniref:hypothetical protein n=1 Tax=Hydrogenovibrio kuenenii TaxID=63658 RepID=UPI000465E605|nr:hypothetical protein [Hydrogenovibrio kuenenii]